MATHPTPKVYRGTEAQRFASTAVPAAGDLIITDEQYVYFGDGVTQARHLEMPADPTVSALENAPASMFGHSFGASDPTLSPGPGADIGGHALERVALRCRTQPLVNLAQGGTRSDQILTSVRTNFVPNTRGVVFLAGGHRNDQNFYTNATPNTVTVREVFRSLFAYLTSRAEYTVSTAAWQLGPGWNGSGVGGVGAYGDYACSGDKAWIEFSAVTGAGGTFTVTDTSGTVLATVTTGGFGVAFTGVVQLAGMGTGSRTVRVQVTAGTVGLVGALVPAATPPLIVWELEPPYNPAIVSGGATANTVNAQYQTATQSVLTQFDTSRIVVVGAPPLWDATVDTCPDGVHPSSSGHRKISSWAVRCLRAAGVKTVQGLSWVTGSVADPTTYTVPAVTYSRPGATAPATPTALAVTTGKQASATWTRADDGGATLTAHKLRYRQTGTSGTWTEVLFGATAVNGAITSGMTQGTGYDVQIAAVNAVGQSSWSSTVTVTAGPVSTVYMRDSFTRADNPTDPGVTEVGNFAWAANPVADAGKWGISANRLVKANGVYTVTLTSGPVTTPGVSFRVSADGSSGWMMDRAASDGTYRLRTRTGTTYTTVFTSAVGLGAAGDVVTVELNGSSVKVSINGALLTSQTSTFNQTATRHGLYVNGSSSFAFDDASFTS